MAIGDEEQGLIAKRVAREGELAWQSGSPTHSLEWVGATKPSGLEGFTPRANFQVGWRIGLAQHWQAARAELPLNGLVEVH